MLASSRAVRAPARIPGRIGVALGLPPVSPWRGGVARCPPRLATPSWAPLRGRHTFRALSTSCRAFGSSNRALPPNDTRSTSDAIELGPPASAEGKAEPRDAAATPSSTSASDAAPSSEAAATASSTSASDAASSSEAASSASAPAERGQDAFRESEPKKPSFSESSSPSTSSTSPQFPYAHGSTSQYVSQLREQLNGHTTKWKNEASKRAQEKLAELKVRAKELAHRWNALSGYEEIEQLKLAVSKLDNELNEHRSTLQAKREAYVSAVSERGASQRQLSDLLGRKPTWTEQDLATYTSLLHSEHSQSRQEKAAESAYNDAEQAVQEAFDELMRAITQRYHEEHIWSDRMRLLSTWGSVAIAVLNAVIFIMALLVVEPYKRRKLANTLETRLLEGEQLNAERMALVIESFEKQIRDLRLSIETLDGDLHESYSAPASAPASAPEVPALIVEEEAEQLDPAWQVTPEEEDILIAPPPTRLQRIRTNAGHAWNKHAELAVAGLVGAVVALLGMAAGQMGGGSA